MRSALLRWPPALIQTVNVRFWGNIIANVRLQPYSRLPEEFSFPHFESAQCRIFYSRFSTYSKLAILVKDEKATVSSTPLKNTVAKKIAYIDNLMIATPNSHITDY